MASSLSHLWATEYLAYLLLMRHARATAAPVSMPASSAPQEELAAETCDTDEEEEEVPLKTETTVATNRAASLVTLGTKQDRVKLASHLGERSSNKEEEVELLRTKLALLLPPVRFPSHVCAFTLDPASFLHRRKLRCSLVTSYRQVSLFPEKQSRSDASAFAGSTDSSSAATKNPAASPSPNPSE